MEAAIIPVAGNCPHRWGGGTGDDGERPLVDGGHVGQDDGGLGAEAVEFACRAASGW